MEHSGDEEGWMALGKKSPPEWGLQLSKGNEHLLSAYKFDSIVHELDG
jgi:hypothetical protein